MRWLSATAGPRRKGTGRTTSIQSGQSAAIHVTGASLPNNFGNGDLVRLLYQGACQHD
jgi:hypothetical protein